MASLGTGFITKKEDKTIQQLSSGGYTNFRENDVIIAKITPCMENGKCALAEGLTNGLGLGSTEFHVFRTSTKERSKFLLEYLNREPVRVVASSYMTGASGHRRVPEYFYKQFPIPNAPDAVVKKMADEFSQVDSTYQRACDIMRKCLEERVEIIKRYIQNNQSTSELGTLIQEITGNKTKIDSGEIVREGKYPVITQEKNVLISGYTDNEDCITDLPLIVFGDHSCSFKYVDFEFVRGADGTQLLKTDPNEVLPKYLYYYLLSIHIENEGRYERHFKYLKKISIPKPSIDIQKKIISECDTIEDELQKANKVISECSIKKQAILDKYLK